MRTRDTTDPYADFRDVALSGSALSSENLSGAKVASHMMWCPYCQKNVHTLHTECVRVDRATRARVREKRHRCRACGAALGTDRCKEPAKDPENGEK